MKPDVQGPASSSRWLVGAVVVVVGAAVAGGLWLSGSPSEARQHKLDERRVADLQALAQAVDAYHALHGHVPPTLDSVVVTPYLAMRSADPSTAAPYPYAVATDSSYTLCATFTFASDGAPVYAPLEWMHPAGRHCFERTAGR